MSEITTQELVKILLPVAELTYGDNFNILTKAIADIMAKEQIKLDKLVDKNKV